MSDEFANRAVKVIVTMTVATLGMTFGVVSLLAIKLLSGGV